MKKKYALLFLLSLLFIVGKGQTNTIQINPRKATVSTNNARPSQGIQLPTPALAILPPPCRTCSDTNTVIYDFQCKRFFIPKANGNYEWIQNLQQVRAHYNREFKLKVVNINRYLYNIDFEADDIEFGSVQPALFKQLFLGDGSYLEGLLGNLNKAAGIAPAFPEKVSEEQEAFLEALNAFLDDYFALQNNQLKAFNYCVDSFGCCKGKETLDYADFAKKLLVLKTTYNAYSQSVASQLADVQKRGAALQKIADACSELTAKIKEEKNQAKRKALETERAKLNCADNERELETTLAKKVLLESIKADLSKLWETVSKITDEDLMKLVLFTNNMVNDHFSYTSPPIFPKSNRLSVGLKISPSDSSLVRKWNIMPLYHDSLGMDLFVQGKWFVSFSAGPFISFGRALRGETYAWQPQPVGGVVPAVPQYKLVSTGNAAVPMGIGAFANIGTKRAPNFGYGLSVGAGIAVEANSRPVYFFGGSFYFGEKQQLNVTVGLVAMSVDRLRSELYPDMTTLYTERPATIEYRKQVAKGGFLAISYTLFSFDRTRSTSGGSKK